MGNILLSRQIYCLTRLSLHLLYRIVVQMCLRVTRYFLAKSGIKRLRNDIPSNKTSLSPEMDFSRYNDHPYALCLRNNALANALHAQSRQPQLRMLDLGNLINVLQTDRMPYSVFPRESCPFHPAFDVWLHPCCFKK